MKKDIINQTFGSLTVITKLDSRQYKQYWLCKCLCGNTIERYTDQLTNKGSKKHCGCLDKKLTVNINQKIGALLVLKETHFFINSIRQGKRKIRAWECLCNCGNKTTISTSDLLTGNTTSCGCNKPNYKVDLTNKVFNRLTVISLNVIRSKNHKYWNCLCSCGNNTTASSNALLSGRTQSCGCLKQDRFKKYRISKGYDPNTPMQKVKTYLRGKILGKTKLKANYNNTCQLCKVVYSNVSLQIHHIIPMTTNEAIYNKPENLIPLCKKCHYIAHNNNWQQIDEHIQKKLAAITGLELK